MEQRHEMLRHCVATVAYRASRALAGSTESFAVFSGAGRTPVQILAHIGDLFAWAQSFLDGKPQWRDSTPLPWSEEKKRLFALLESFDATLAAAELPDADAKRLLQGPVADALTHVGQIAMLRRMASCPIPGENFYVAKITTGVVGEDQPAPVRTF